jgi:hypothetical protein
LDLPHESPNQDFCKEKQVFLHSQDFCKEKQVFLHSLDFFLLPIINLTPPFDLATSILGTFF